MTTTTKNAAVSPMETAILATVQNLFATGQIEIESNDETSAANALVIEKLAADATALREGIAETFASFTSTNAALLARVETIENRKEKRAKAGNVDAAAVATIVDGIIREYAAKTTGTGEGISTTTLPEPLLPVDPYFVENETTDEIKFHLSAGRHMMISGPSGSGKTFPVEQCLRQLGRRYITIGCSEGMVLDHFTARAKVTSDANGTQTGHDDGFLARAMRHGWALIIDECDKLGDEILTVLYGVCEPGKTAVLEIVQTGERLVAAPGFVVIGTCNSLRETAGNYGGQPLTTAFTARFVGVKADYLPKKAEREILARVGLADADANVLVGFLHGLRAAYYGNKIARAPSTRLGVRVARFMLGLNDAGTPGFEPVTMAKAFEYVLLNMMPDNERNEALAVLQMGI